MVTAIEYNGLKLAFVGIVWNRALRGAGTGADIL